MNKLNFYQNTFIMAFFLYSTLSLASTGIAEVVVIRGKVTQLAPFSKDARLIKKGERLKEDTSILTHDKSFIRIRFDNGTSMSLGPKSKAIVSRVKMTKTNVVSFLKGKMRTKVIKDAQSGQKNKHLIKTRNAAMGVRGTEFVTVFNPEGNLTSLVTFEGEVAMVQTDSIKSKSSKGKKKVVRNDDQSIDLENTSQKEALSDDKLEEALNTKETVLVKPGQFSGTVDKIKAISQPVNISPVQLNVLYKNTDMKEKTSKKVDKADLDPNKQRLLLKSVAQEVPPEGTYNQKDKIYAPKSGGLLDLNTGLYVPPSKDAVFDPRYKVYVAANVGNIDQDTGQYKAPQGLKLDSKKGFVVKNLKKNAPKELQAKLAQKQSNMNSDLGAAYLPSSKKIKIQETIYFNRRQLMAKDSISLSVMGLSSLYQVDDDAQAGGSAEFEDDGAKKLTFKWEHNTGNKWQPVIGLSLLSLNYFKKSINNFTLSENPNSKQYSLSGAIRYSYHRRWSLVGRISLDQELYLDHDTSTSTHKLERVTLPKIAIGVEGDIFISGRYSLDSGLYLTSNLPKESGSLKVSTGFGGEFFIGPKMWMSKASWVKATLGASKHTEDVEGSGFTSHADHDYAGIELGIGKVF
jgi:hypothetical protein